MLKRILIADDSGIIRTLIRTSLEAQSSFEIYEAADGVEVIEKAKTLKPDLILLDLVMPRMSGVEAASVLKRLMPAVPMVLFTLHVDRIGQSLARAIGVDKVLEKPDGMTRLLESIGELLSRPKTQSAASGD